MIIPTLNEAGFISKTIQNISSKAAGNSEIELIVVDSGSCDQTVEIVNTCKSANLYSHPELKGQKYAILNKGAQYANGDILLFLDADTLLPEHFDTLIISQAIENGFIGGAFEFKLSGKE